MSRISAKLAKIARLPATPGVYFFKNKAGEIIYIGKSGSLKNRVKSYFQKGAKFFNAAKQKMLTEIADIEILKNESEIEALIKESELIKKHKPKFNVLMRDSKNYLYVGFSKEDFPKIYPTHQPRQIKNLKLKIKNYVGPFTDAGAVRKTLKILRDIFPYCTCKQKHITRCLNAHMGRCLGVCCLKLGPTSDLARDRCSRLMLTRYRKNIQAIKRVLSGQSQIVLKDLKLEIKKQIKLSNFEKAQELKKQIIDLTAVLSHARVLTEKIEFSPAIFKDDLPNFSLLGFKKYPERIETYDISNIQGHEAVGSMVVFEKQADSTYRPNKNEYRKFKIKTVSGINDTAMMAEIVRRRFNNDWPWPQLIIIDGGPGQLNAALKALGKNKIKIVSLAKRLEEIYLPGRKEAMLAQSFGQSLKHLFQTIRDEAHRFAVSYHRRLHKQAILKS